MMRTGNRTRSPLLLLTVAAALALAVVAFAARPAHASVELDRRYALETVGFLKAYDNVDGLFADYVATAYRDYFARQSRFVLQDLSRANDLLERSKLPYYKVIDDPEILGQLARSMRAQTILRTKIKKEGPHYRFLIDWLHAPHMDLIASEGFVLDEHRDGSAIGLGDFKGALQMALDRIIAKVPFKGQVTGRDGTSVTLNIGALAGLKVGDEVVLGTLEEVKRHPLLGQLMDWRFSRTGKVGLDQVEDGLSFGHVLEEEEGRQIARYQKVVQVISQPRPEEPRVITDRDEAADRAQEQPHLGYVAAGTWLGGFSRDHSSAGNGVTGGGILTGGRMEGQLWFTKEWFGELKLGYGTVFGYTQNAVGSGGAAAGTSATTGLSVTDLQFQLDAGYTYLLSDDYFGTKGWARMGYRSNSYTLTTSASDLTSPIGFHSLFLGIGGEFPVRPNWGFICAIDFGIFTGATETGLNDGNVTGASDVQFYVGGFYRFNARVTLRVGIEFVGQSADFDSGTNISHRMLTFSPLLLYYF